MEVNKLQKIGVFVCWCGSNIAGTVDVEKVAQSVAGEPGVVISTDYQYMCSEGGQSRIRQAIHDYGLTGIVVCSCSPRMHETTFRKTAQAARIIGIEDFLEIYVSTPLVECEKRDVKGLYAKARRGEIKNFTGISAPFEAPEHPALSLDTSKLSLEESVNTLLELVLPIVGKKGEKI